MKSLTLGTLFLPEWALPWVFVVAIAAWIVGARALATAASLLLMVELVIAPLLAPWLATLPAWVLFLIGALMVLLVLHGVVEFLFGQEAAGHVTGSYLVRLIDFLILGPFRLLGSLVRAFRHLG